MVFYLFFFLFQINIFLFQQIFQLIENNFSPFDDFMKISTTNSLSGVEFKIAMNKDFRPKLKDESIHPGWIVDLMKKSWDHDPNIRPSFQEIVVLLREKMNTPVEENKVDDVKNPKEDVVVVPIKLPALPDRELRRFSENKIDPPKWVPKELLGKEIKNDPTQDHHSDRPVLQHRN